MAKDPAVLFFIGNWLTATAEMDSDVRGWYLNLILHHFDKGSLPNDPEKLAVLAGVKFSEFERFKHVLEHVLMHKLTLNEETGRLENGFASTILKSREAFKEKKSRAGNIGVVIKLAKTIKGFTEKYIKLLKDDLYSFSEEEILRAKSEHVLEHMLKLYINRNKNIDNTISYDFIIKEDFKEIFNRWMLYKSARKEKYKNQDSIQACYSKLLKLSSGDSGTATLIIEDAIANNYAGFFALKTGVQQQVKPSTIHSSLKAVGSVEFNPDRV